jgi:anti-repressor protein
MKTQNVLTEMLREETDCSNNLHINHKGLKVNKEIIAVNLTEINEVEVNSVNSREVYEYLGVETPYSMWIQRAIEKYDFTEDEDFTTHKFVNGKATQIDYIVTIDMAKELCMVSNTPKGKETRKYFIEIEKQANKPLTIEQLLEQNVKVIGQLKDEVLVLQHKVDTDKPKVSYAEAVVGSINPISIREWINTLKSDEGLRVGERKVIAYLIEKKFIYRDKKNKLQPYAKYATNYFSLIPITMATPKGNREYTQLKITGIGQLEVGNRILEHFNEAA